jgi:hypothetical protein
MSPTTTQADPQQSAADLAPLMALVAAQAAARAQLTAQAVAMATAAAAAFTGWYSADQITAWAVKLASQMEALQRAQAQSTDAYLARAMSTIVGGRIRPSGRVDVADLRSGITHAGAYARAADVYRWQQSQFDQFARVLAETQDVAALAPLDLVDPIEAAKQRVAAVADMDIQLADRAQSTATMSDQSRKIEVRGYRRVIHPELSKGGTCGLCIAASNRVYHVEDLKALHARCVPGDTIVAAEDVSAITRRNYPSPLIVLTTASGQELRITANHPVLTAEGWVPAGLVNIGTDVFRHRLGHGVTGRCPDEKNGPATVEQVWRAATVDHGLDPRAVPLSAEDFHGDGTDGEVDVVSTSGLLSGVGDVSFSQPARQSLLVPGHGRGIRLAGQGAPDQALFGLWNPSHGEIGSFGLLTALIAGHLGRADESGFTGVANGYTCGHQPSSNDLARHAKVARDGQHRFTGLVPSHDLLVRQAQPDASRFDPALAEFAGEGRHAYAQLGRDLRERLAADVEPDRVVDKRWVEGPHVVYNLHAREGWYSAGNLIVSNCECTVLPIVGQHDPGSSLNNLDLKKLYADAGDSTNRADLKRTRYKIEQHGELGPVLTDGKFRTARQARRDTNRPSKPKTPERTREDLNRILGMEMGAQEKAHALAKADPRKWGKYSAALDARIADLLGQLAQPL